MDNSCGQPPEAARWAPKPVAVGAAWAGAAGALAWAVVTDEPPGRVLAFAATGLLVAFALVGTVVRPRLAADTRGLRLGRFGGARDWEWPAVHRIEVVASRRFGRRVGMLEIDTADPDGTDHLVVLTALDLGADPEDVATELDRLSGRPCTRRP